MIRPHTCSPATWCALCDHNERAGGTRNHPDAPRRPAQSATPARRPLTVVTCAHLTPSPVRLPGSPRLWQQCTGGYGSTFPDGRKGMVCGCSTATPGLWRKGWECGERCPGYTTEAGGYATAAAAPDLYGPIGVPPIPGPYTGPSPPAPRRAASVVADLPRWHPVPPPDLTPTRPRAVVTLVVGDDAEQLHAVTGPSQRRYAERIGAEFVVIRGATQDPRMPCAEKWRLKDYVPLFPDGTVYFDADVWVGADAPDILAATPPDAVGMVDVSPATPGLLDWFPGEVRRMCETQGITPPAMERKYWNSGVWAGRPAQAHYWNPPPLPYPVQWCTEEMWCRLNAQLTGLRIHDLDPRFNWTWIEDRQLARVGERRPWVWHFAGMGNKEAEKLPQWQQGNRVWRLALLRLLAAVGG